ncbi:Mu transposase C-terminal domain-containing protein [Pseudomonas syringae]|uniref:Mu transposase C-terminal domain-containing protein n=1 Tax=Pseudomonas syringae TaxID=317 RepID=UPI0002A78F88|nr:Mu transposase C-terminal domain-containing protein [Pseudomonas syringae]ELP96361.1 hypothetical protein A979_22752 [Pseudomonas syringae BRIP34876]
MDIIRIVTRQGVRFNNRLYWSDALEAIVGLRVRLQFDGPARDSALVIWGDSVIEVKLWKRRDPSIIKSLLTAAGDSSAERPPSSLCALGILKRKRREGRVRRS